MSTLTPSPILSVEDINVNYHVAGSDVTAVSNVSFDLAPGERMAIVGESGSGKSTLSTAVAGFLSAPNASISHGRFIFDGHDVDRTKIHQVPQRTEGISMVFQDAMTSLDPVWSVGSQLLNVLRTQAKRAGRRLTAAEANAEARNWLAKVGLTDSHRIMKARPFELSGGMRQRVMLAIALCGAPKVLIADEPTSALDAALSREVMELMVQLTDDLGAALIIVTHDIGLCLDYAHRVLVMNRGHVVDDRDATTVEHTAEDPYTIGLLACVPTLDSVNLDQLPTLEGASRLAFATERLAS